VRVSSHEDTTQAQVSVLVLQQAERRRFVLWPACRCRGYEIECHGTLLHHSSLVSHGPSVTYVVNDNSNMTATYRERLDTSAEVRSSVWRHTLGLELHSFVYPISLG